MSESGKDSMQRVAAALIVPDYAVSTKRSRFLTILSALSLLICVVCVFASVADFTVGFDITKNLGFGISDGYIGFAEDNPALPGPIYLMLPTWIVAIVAAIIPAVWLSGRRRPSFRKRSGGI